MTLTDLRAYLKGRPGATLVEIAHHFRVDPDIVREMLAVWIRKGKVEKRSMGAGCGSACSRCDPASIALFVWTEGAGPSPAPLDLGCRR
jgi:hypothetical protein